MEVDNDSYLYCVHVKPQIKASLLLGLFSLMLLHQVIPHLHHEHEEEHHHGVADKAHSHEHRHEKESEDPKGLFSILMAMHSHGGSSSEVPVVKNAIEYVSIKKVKTKDSAPKLISLQNAFSEDIAADLIRNYQPPPKYFDPYLSLLSLRGPPNLV